MRDSMHLGVDEERKRNHAKLEMDFRTDGVALRDVDVSPSGSWVVLRSVSIPEHSSSQLRTSWRLLHGTRIMRATIPHRS